jgi:hypothetical protein
MNGMRAVKLLCQSACGGSTAHLCSKAEVTLSWQSWLFPATSAWISNPGDYTDGVNTVSDCNQAPLIGNGDQWVIGTSGYYGSTWFGGGTSCDTPLPFACCM